MDNSHGRLFTDESPQLINLSKGEKEKEVLKSPVYRIAHEVYDFADETVAHAEGVSTSADPLIEAAQREGIDTNGKSKQEIASALSWKLNNRRE